MLFFSGKNYKTGPFSLQLLNKSTDVSKEVQFMPFVQYRDILAINEHFLFCKKLTGRTTGEDVFPIINSFFSEHRANPVFVCTPGRVKGF
jgi:hypothetical protein